MAQDYKYMNSNNLEELAVFKFVVVQGSGVTLRGLDYGWRQQVLLALYKSTRPQVSEELYLHLHRCEALKTLTLYRPSVGLKDFICRSFSVSPIYGHLYFDG
jgi:hypothetical protein